LTVQFESSRGLILITAKLHGPAMIANLVLALDTGATGTIISQSRLIAAGYDPAAGIERIQMTTGSGVEFAPRVLVTCLEALGLQSRNLPVLAHTLPPNVRVDGLLGLDFLRGRELRIDFRVGTIELSE